MNRQKRFREIFRFRGDIRSQSSKIGCQRSQRQRGHPIFSLSLINSGQCISIYIFEKKFTKKIFKLKKLLADRTWQTYSKTAKNGKINPIFNGNNTIS